MSGHSKWSTIKHKKGAADARRGKIFSRVAKEIAVAARAGGGDPSGNPRLRAVLIEARSENMPKENIDRAIKRGTGELPGVTYEEARFEAYAPGGVAIMVDILTDNRNRTVAEIRHILTRNGGSMAESGAVMWNFEQKGTILISKTACTEDEMLEKAIEAGAEDVDSSGEVHEITTAPNGLYAVVKALEAGGVKVDSAQLTMAPKTTMKVEGREAASVLRLVEALEEHDDVQNVYANFDISEADMVAAVQV
jgi:YebC/PmpR family DNA-binding regulatory protein